MENMFMQIGVRAMSEIPNGRESNMRKVIVGIVLIGICSFPAMMLTANAGASQASKWVKWDNKFTPVFNKMDATYKAVGVALNDDNTARALQLFQTYGAEAITLSRDANSPSKKINKDVRSLAILDELWAQNGSAALNGSVSLSTFTSINNALTSELIKFTRDLSKT